MNRYEAQDYAVDRWGEFGRAWAEWHMADGKMQLVRCYVGYVVGPEVPNGLAANRAWEAYADGPDWATTIEAAESRPQ